MERKCQLPFVEPEIMSNAYYAFSWGVIKGNLGDEYDKILSRKFINCYFEKPFQNEKFVIATADSLSEKQNVILNQALNIHKDVASALRLDFVSIIKQCILNGYYVFNTCPSICFNESDSQNSKTKFLIIGYDSINERFIIKASNQVGGMKTYEVNDREFIDRLLNLPKENIELKFWRFNKDNPLILDLSVIVAEFSDYINSKTSLVQYTQNKIYGFEAFERLIEYLKEKLLLGQIFKQELLQSVVDHKYCMWKRLKYFTQQQIISSEYVASAEIVYKLTTSVLSLGLEYNVTADRSIGEKAIEFLKNLIEKEKEYLPRVLEELTVAKLSSVKYDN